MTRDLQCVHKTKSGARCRAIAVSGSTMCFAHDPALADKRTAARRRGGEQKRHAVLGPDEPEISLRSCSDACELTNRLIDHLLRGEADPKVTNSVLGLLNFWQGAYKTEILEQRVAAIEAAQNGGLQRSPYRLEGAEQFGARRKES